MEKKVPSRGLKTLEKSKRSLGPDGGNKIHANRLIAQIFFILNHDFRHSRYRRTSKEA